MYARCVCAGHIVVITFDAIMSVLLPRCLDAKVYKMGNTLYGNHQRNYYSLIQLESDPGKKREE